MNNRPFNRRKFIELIRYIACRSAHDPGFSLTRLNLILFFCDSMAYRRLGQPLTNETYRNGLFCPVPSHIDPVMREMVPHDESIDVLKYLASMKHDIALFSKDEIDLINDVIERLRGVSIAQANDVFRHSGLKAAETCEEIPYETALISATPPGAEDLDPDRMDVLEQEAARYLPNAGS